jgi:hypothetical protein
MDVPKIKKTADLPGGLSGSLCRFYCHWQRTIIFSAGMRKKSRFIDKEQRCAVRPSDVTLSAALGKYPAITGMMDAKIGG